MKIAFFGVKPWEKELIEKEIIRLPSYGVGIFEQEVGDDLDLAKNYEVISTFIYSKMDKTVLDRLPKLKMIATRSTATNHIDCAECKKRGIIFKNVAEYGSSTIAEYVFGLLLAVTKKIVIAHQSVEEGEFAPAGLTGVDLDKKTLGVVGVGKIGQKVIRIARGFGMKVLGVERSQDPLLAKKLGFKYADLETCLKESDFVTLHVPLTLETQHLINKKNIRLMKKGSYLINICRGPVVETSALVWALNNRILAGAGLDVTEEEENAEDVSVVAPVASCQILLNRDDVVFTPHNAFNTKEAIKRIVKTTVDNILEFIK